ncbi:MAG: hypothetical protein K5765_08110 [Clostridia bacterium]|nr:hypothetical protein [Clostridia bacterium]
MNTGIITKIEYIADEVKYYIRLDRNFTLNNYEYNIYIIDNGKTKPTAEVFGVKYAIVMKNKACVVTLNTKYEFELEFDSNSNPRIIKSISTIA